MIPHIIRQTITLPHYFVKYPKYNMKINEYIDLLLLLVLIIF